MAEFYDLSRYTRAHRGNYARALSEIRAGRKTSHWMWYIFPQLQGLGRSDTSRYYALKGLEEARAFLADPVLGRNLLEICRALLALPTDSALEVLGTPDNLKLRSSMTLFAQADRENPVFPAVLDKFFGGRPDRRTLALLGLPPR
jgi:uncharacterized protein (DUF1810 family)